MASPNLNAHVVQSNSGESNSSGDAPSFQDALRLELLRLLQSGVSVTECMSRFPANDDLIRQLHASTSCPAGDDTHISLTAESISTVAPTAIGQRQAATGTTAFENRPQLIGRYEIQEIIGSGSFGNVYRAYDPQLDLVIALKVPIRGAFQFPGERERFLREARAAVAVRHPGICPVYDVGETADGQCFLALGFVDGESLGQRLIRLGVPEPRTTARWVQQIAVAMAEAHHCGIIHRDLKPANIMLDSRSRPVIMDFGLARRDGSDDAVLTQQGQILGTPAYMAPEQALGDQAQVGPLSDVYSLGTILYELLTGQRPHKGKLVDVLSRLGKTVPPAPRTLNAEIDPELESICSKAMALVPGERWASMEQLGAALESWLRVTAQDVPTVVQFPLVDEAPLSPRKRHPLRAWFGKHKVISIALTCAIFSFMYLASTVVFTAREGTVKIDVQDPSIGIRIDGSDVSFENLALPLILHTGEHNLEVRHGTLTVETRRFRIETGKHKSLEVTYTPKIPAISLAEKTPPAPLKGEPVKLLPSKMELSGAPTVPPEASPSVPVQRNWSPTILKTVNWVFENGGRIHYRLGTNAREASQLQDLPTGPWSLTGIQIPQPMSWNHDTRTLVMELSDLEYLTLQSSQLVDLDFECLANLPRLTSLVLNGGDLTEARLKSLARMQQLISLQLISTTIADIAPLAPLRKLNVLWIIHNPQQFGRRVGEPISLTAFEQFDSVTDLSLSGQQIDDTSVAHIAVMPRLSRLHFANTNLTDAGLRQVAACAGLRSLFLDRTAVTDTGVAEFLEKTHAQLNGISLAETSVTDKGLEALAKCKELIDLNLADTRISDATLKRLVNCSRLSSLWLTNTAVSDSGIAALRGTRQLLTLDLTGTTVTDRSLEDLEQLSRINYLGLRGTKISAAGSMRLQQTLPRCRVEW